MNEIVVGVDGSESSAQASAWAVQEGERQHRPVRAVLAWTQLDQHLADPSDRYDPDDGEPDAARALGAYIVRAVGPDQAANVERRVLCELPAPALLEASAGAALLAVGARGLGGFKSLLLGSVSSQCLHHARCQVAIIRSGSVPKRPPARRSTPPSTASISAASPGRPSAASSWAAARRRSSTMPRTPT
jgi:nucleotide-binding universal stress UspA family protein